MKFYKVACTACCVVEHGLGLTNIVFSDEKEAEDKAREAFLIQFSDDPIASETFQRLWGNGIKIESVNLIGSVPSPLKGYPTLSEEQIAQINQIRELGPVISALVDEIANHDLTDKRWAALARTSLQSGLMYLTRSVARPELF